MGCLSLSWLMNLLIWLVVIGAVVGIVRLILPYVLGPLGEMGNLIMRALTIIIWAIVLIAIILLVFDLLGCLVGSPLNPRRG